MLDDEIEEVRVIDLGGADSNGGASKITSNVTKTMLGLQESLKESTGMDLKSMLESFVSRGQADHFKKPHSEVAAGEEEKKDPEAKQEQAPTDTAQETDPGLK